MELAARRLGLPFPPPVWLIPSMVSLDMVGIDLLLEAMLWWVFWACSAKSPRRRAFLNILFFCARVSPCIRLHGYQMHITGAIIMHWWQSINILLPKGGGPLTVWCYRYLFGGGGVLLMFAFEAVIAEMVWLWVGRRLVPITDSQLTKPPPAHARHRRRRRRTNTTQHNQHNGQKSNDGDTAAVNIDSLLRLLLLPTYYDYGCHYNNVIRGEKEPQPEQNHHTLSHKIKWLNTHQQTSITSEDDLQRPSLDVCKRPLTVLWRGESSNLSR